MPCCRCTVNCSSYEILIHIFFFFTFQSCACNCYKYMHDIYYKTLWRIWVSSVRPHILGFLSCNRVNHFIWPMSISQIHGSQGRQCHLGLLKGHSHCLVSAWIPVKWGTFIIFLTYFLAVVLCYYHRVTYLYDSFAVMLQVWNGNVSKCDNSIGLIQLNIMNYSSQRVLGRFLLIEVFFKHGNN